MELAELKASIRDLGLSNPIRVEPKGQGRYELVQGLRRLNAYRELLAETKDRRYARDPGRADGDGGEGSRRFIGGWSTRTSCARTSSFAEMADAGAGLCSDPGTDCERHRQGGGGSCSRARAIRSGAISGPLPRCWTGSGTSRVSERDPAATSGSTLRRRLEQEPGIAGGIARDLKDWDNRSVRDELDVLRRWAGAGEGDETFPAGKIPKPPARSRTRKAKVTFQLTRAEGGGANAPPPTGGWRCACRWISPPWTGGGWRTPCGGELDQLR